jgi:ABC-2 type transport system permease protein
VALFITRAENVQYIWYNFYRLGMRPDVIYPQWLRYIVLGLVPVGFMASVPARMITEGFKIEIVVWGYFLGFVLVWLTTQWWKFAISKYTSASS